MLSVTAPAKINLYLAVGDRRPDGYHDVTTVLHTLALADTVTLAEAPALSLACDRDLGIAPEDNLAYRAAASLAARLGREAQVAITIEKRIPAGGGLGGASADAAAVLCGLATLWDIEPTSTQVAEVAAGLGADVPFFLRGGAALYVGRGDTLARQLPALDVPVVLVNPGEPVPTALAYATFDRLLRPGSPSVDAMVGALESGDVSAVGRALHNDLSEASFDIVPAIADVVRLLSSHPGTLGAAMAGSGSSAFALCEDDAAAAHAAAMAASAGFWAVATRTERAGCLIRDAG